MFLLYVRLQKATNNHTTMKQETLENMIAMTNQMMIMTTMDITIITITMFTMSLLSFRLRRFKAMIPTSIRDSCQAQDSVKIMLFCHRLRGLLSTLMIIIQLKEYTTLTTIIQMIILVKLMLKKNMKPRFTDITTDQTV